MDRPMRTSSRAMAAVEVVVVVVPATTTSLGAVVDSGSARPLVDSTIIFLVISFSFCKRAHYFPLDPLSLPLSPTKPFSTLLLTLSFSYDFFSHFLGNTASTHSQANLYFVPHLAFLFLGKHELYLPFFIYLPPPLPIFFSFQIMCIISFALIFKLYKTV